MFPSFGGLGTYGTYGNLGLFGALVAYGSLGLTQSSPPQSFSEPLTIDEVAAYLRLPASLAADPAVQDELLGYIIAAREQAEIGQGRDLVMKQWDYSFDYWPSYCVELRAPLVSLDLIRYRDSGGHYTTLATDVDYIVDGSKAPPVLAPPYNKSWPTYTPWPSSSLLVRFTSGLASNDPWWSDAGARVKVGMKVLIKNWFNREALADAQMEAIRCLLSQGGIPRAK